jgi:predicted permease
MPADFPGLQPGTAQPERFWIPFAAGPASFERDMSFLRVLGRLRAEVDPEVALLAMESVAREQEREDPLGIEGRLVRLVPQAEVVTGNVRTQLLVLLGAVFLLLAIACANLAGLLLVRGAARGRELALREALGAGRRRLVAQLLVESLLLAGLGALLAVPLAWTLLRGVSALGPQGLPRLGEVALDPRALLFCALAALGSALAFGLLPALRATGADPRARLAEGTGASGPTLLQRALVTGQVAMATVLLVGAGLLGTSLLLLERSDTGFDAAGTLTFRVSPPAGLGPDELAEFQARVLEGTGALPGVKAAGASWALPLGGMYGSGGFLVEGGAGAAGGSRSEYTLEIVPILGGYLDAMGMRLQRGRAFQPGDGDQAETPILVSATLAARAWPGEDALGKRLLEEEDGEIEATYRVVGVVADVTLRGPGAEPELLAYLPQEATPWATDLFYVARTGGDPEALVAGVREVVRRVDDRVPLADVGTMDARLARHLAAPRFRTLLVLLFAAAAGSLSLLGIYGVTSFAVGRRTREIGVRVALGAERGRVLLGVMGDGLRLAALGALLGVLGAAALARTVESLLYGVAPLEPSVYLAVATLVLAAAALATWLPARRAASVSPTVALRVE